MLRGAPYLLLIFGFAWALAAGAQGAVDPEAFTERRVALVIGNGGYGPEIGRLANPGHDARGPRPCKRSPSRLR